MAIVSKESYLRLIENRPYKFDADEVDYIEAIKHAKYSFLQTDEPCCKKCIHFFTREVDDHHTCEIFRPDDDASVDPEYVCDFFSVDGTEFPLLHPEE